LSGWPFGKIIFGGGGSPLLAPGIILGTRGKNLGGKAAGGKKHGGGDSPHFWEKISGEKFPKLWKFLKTPLFGKNFGNI